MSPVAWMSPALTSPGPVRLQRHALGAFALHPDRDVLDVEDDVGDVLAHAGDRGEFMQHAVDVDGGDGGALQRRQQDAAQRVAERQAEAALQRFGDHGGDALAVVAGRDASLFGLISSCQFFWIMSDLFLGSRISVRQPWPVAGYGTASPVGLADQSRSRRAATGDLTGQIRRGGACAGGSRCAGSASRRGSR